MCDFISLLGFVIGSNFVVDNRIDKLDKIIKSQNLKIVELEKKIEVLSDTRSEK